MGVSTPLKVRRNMDPPATRLQVVPRLILCTSPSMYAERLGPQEIPSSFCGEIEGGVTPIPIISVAGVQREARIRRS